MNARVCVCVHVCIEDEEEHKVADDNKHEFSLDE